MTNKNKEIVSAWITMHLSKENSPEYFENFWAYDLLNELVETVPSESLEIIDKILSINDSEIIVANLAAGPVEDLLVKHGDIVILNLEEHSKRNPVWRKLMGCVWRNDIQEHIWKQVEKITNSK